MKLKFTSEHFDNDDHANWAANKAQHAYEDYLKEYGLEVFASVGCPWWKPFGFNNTNTHRALLVEIEDLDKKPCTHEPQSKTHWVCGKCNEEIEPNGWQSKPTKGEEWKQ